jgi:hypothetical protein
MPRVPIALLATRELGEVTEFQIGASNVAAPLVGTLDLLAVIQGKKTLVEFKTGANDWGEHDVLLCDQLTAYRGAEPDVEQTAICVFVKKRESEIIWHFTERTPAQQVEYLRKMEMVEQQITQRVFYKRAGFCAVAIRQVSFPCSRLDVEASRSGNY